MGKKIGIILLIIIVLIGFIYGIRAIKNFFIIQSIFSEVQENLKKENYYLRTTITHSGESSLSKIFYKNGIGKMVAENGLYTWVDGENAYMMNEENKTIYTLDLEKSLGLVSNEMFASLIPGYSKNAFERFVMAGNVQNKIKSEKVDDKKCYKIQIKEDYNVKTYWIEKNSKKPIKASITFSNGDNYQYDYELQFGVTKIKDVELPDISQYTIIENQ